MFKMAERSDGCSGETLLASGTNIRREYASDFCHDRKSALTLYLFNSRQQASLVLLCSYFSVFQLEVLERDPIRV